MPQHGRRGTHALQVTADFSDAAMDGDADAAVAGADNGGGDAGGASVGAGADTGMGEGSGAVGSGGTPGDSAGMLGAVQPTAGARRRHVVVTAALTNATRRAAASQGPVVRMPGGRQQPIKKTLKRAAGSDDANGDATGAVAALSSVGVTMTDGGLVFTIDGGGGGMGGSGDGSADGGEDRDDDADAHDSKRRRRIHDSDDEDEGGAAPGGDVGVELPSVSPTVAAVQQAPEALATASPPAAVVRALRRRVVITAPVSHDTNVPNA